MLHLLRRAHLEGRRVSAALHHEVNLRVVFLLLTEFQYRTALYFYVRCNKAPREFDNSALANAVRMKG